MWVGILLLAAVATPDLELVLAPAPGRLSVQMALNRELPAQWTQALAAGAPMSITYRMHLLRNRRWLWDRRLARHDVVIKAQRDPLTGVFTLVAELDGEILASAQAESLDDAIRWVKHPPTAELPLPLRHEPLWLIVRAEFLTHYKMLVFPSTEGTDWLQKAIPEAP
jgi:hypothetical protein